MRQPNKLTSDQAIVRRCWFVLGLTFCSYAAGYEVQTHAFFGREAFGISNLNGASPASTELYLRLGFDRLAAPEPFQQDALTNCTGNSAVPQNDSYIDPKGEWLENGAVPPDAANRKFRCIQRYELESFPPDYRKLVPSSLGPSPGSAF